MKHRPGLMDRGRACMDGRRWNGWSLLEEEYGDAHVAFVSICRSRIARRVRRVDARIRVARRGRGYPWLDHDPLAHLPHEYALRLQHLRPVPSPAGPGWGNVSFGQVTSGDHLVTLTASWQPNEFLRMKVYCTNTVTGSGPNEAPIIYGNQAKFWVWLAPSGKLVCDVYFLPESGQ